MSVVDKRCVDAGLCAVSKCFRDGEPSLSFLNGYALSIEPEHRVHFWQVVRSELRNNHGFDIEKELAVLVAITCAAKGKTRADAAAEIGVSPQALSQLEGGKSCEAQSFVRIITWMGRVPA